MGLQWQPDITLLGTGGEKPCLEIFKADSGKTQKIIEFDSGHSAYAIDINLEQETIAVGTKCGKIHLVTSDQKQDFIDSIPKNKLIQGAPILSICWINKTLLAVSDTAGRCLVWSVNQGLEFRPLKVKRGDICGLISLNDNTLVGLSSEGILHFWQPIECKLIRTESVPKPPPIKALVRMVYWPAHQALVFPGPEGYLTIFNLENYLTKDFNAHRGDFYVISLYKDNLLTLGMDDGYLKIWEAETGKPKHVIKAPKGVISANFVGISTNRILLIEKHGKAGFYAFEKDNLQLINIVPGRDYRSVVSPDQKKIQVIYVKKKEDEVQSIVTEIKEKIGHASTEVIDRLHSQLIKMGYKRISLMLRAEHAEQNGEILESLKYCSSLMEFLPNNDSGSCISMERYAALLEKFWHLTKADAICKQILQIDPYYEFSFEVNKLKRNADFVRTNNIIIEPDISIESIIESAEIISKQFAGRYIIKKLEPYLCEKVILSPNKIAEKFNMLREGPENKSFPEAITEKVWLISKESVDEIDIVALGNGLTNKIEGFQFVLKVSSDEMNTVVYPLALFDWRIGLESQLIKDNNNLAAESLKSIRNKNETILYRTSVFGLLQDTLSRLIGANLAKRRRKD